MAPETPLRLGVWQTDLTGRTPQQRLNRLAEVAATAGTDLLLCPELFLSGYAVGDALSRHAEPADGPSAARIADIARATGTAIAYGYPESLGKTLYNAAQCVDATGSFLGNHRKTVLPPGFEVDYFTAGGRATLFNLGGITIAVLICYEVEFPESARAAALSGAQLILAPTALGAQWPVVAQRVIPARAVENGVFVAYANHAGREGGIDYLGSSCIVGPDGQDLARAGATAEVIATDIDAAQVTRMQRRLPYLRDSAQLP